MFKEAMISLAALFAVMTAFFTLIPVWSSYSSSLNAVAAQLITNTDFANQLPILNSNLAALIPYSFVAIAVGLVIYIFLIPFIEEVRSDALPF